MSKMSKLKSDLIAGFCVFLLALPLCLGIATVSSCPPTAGIIAAIVGGILGALLGGAELSIKGPAAGLVVIVLGAVTQLGNGDLYLGYRRMLAAGVIAGVIQVILAIRKKAILAEVIPPFVIHGMLAAIGVIIISKQSYALMGITPTVSKPLALLATLPTRLTDINPMIFAFGVTAFIIVVVWPKIKKISRVPSSIVILLITISLSVYFNLNTRTEYEWMGTTYALGTKFFIHLPLQFLDAIQFPDFSVVFSPISLKYIIMLALVGGIESLLTVCAIDSMKPDNKPADLNRDLRTLGIGNIVSALLGGLPMISEIVRSKANIDYGATSVKANFFHGLFMLIAIVVFPTVINFVPLAVLAALLICVGLRLASPREFIHAYHVGKDQFFIFLTTFFLTLTIDLLVGVVVGILLKLTLHMARGNSLRSILNPSIKMDVLTDHIRIEIEGPLTFMSYLKLKEEVKKAAALSKHITISLCAVTYLDHTALKKLLKLNNEFLEVEVSIEENQELLPFYNHELSARRKV